MPYSKMTVNDGNVCAITLEHVSQRTDMQQVTVEGIAAEPRRFLAMTVWAMFLASTAVKGAPALATAPRSVIATANQGEAGSNPDLLPDTGLLAAVRVWGLPA